MLRFLPVFSKDIFTVIKLDLFQFRAAYLQKVHVTKFVVLHRDIVHVLAPGISGVLQHNVSSPHLKLLYVMPVVQFFYVAENDQTLIIYELCGKKILYFNGVLATTLILSRKSTFFRGGGGSSIGEHCN